VRYRPVHIPVSYINTIPYSFLLLLLLLIHYRYTHTKSADISLLKYRSREFIGTYFFSYVELVPIRDNLYLPYSTNLNLRYVCLPFSYSPELSRSYRALRRLSMLSKSELATHTDAYFGPIYRLSSLFTWKIVSFYLMLSL